jgi:hypothetical protein
MGIHTASPPLGFGPLALILKLNSERTAGSPKRNPHSPQKTREVGNTCFGTLKRFGALGRRSNASYLVGGLNGRGRLFAATTGNIGHLRFVQISQSDFPHLKFPVRLRCLDR